MKAEFQLEKLLFRSDHLALLKKIASSKVNSEKNQRPVIFTSPWRSLFTDHWTQNTDQ